MYNFGYELLAVAKEKNMRISEVVLLNETEQTGRTPEEVKNRQWDYYEVMVNSATSAIEQPRDTMGMMIKGDAQKMNKYMLSGNTISGDFMNKMMARALSCSEVNASMGRICAAPTAGACGILPAVTMTVAERFGKSRDEILDALLVASGVGQIIVKNATVAGAEGGCQVECGSAAAMAAAASVVMAGGSDEQALNASAIALKNVLGLVCDPVAGLVEVPCAKRNASQSANAISAAEMSLAGIKSNIPFDECVEAMMKVGRMLPCQLRETAQGGLAVTPTGRKIDERLHPKN